MNTELILLTIILIWLLFIDRFLRHFLAKQVIMLGFHLFGTHTAGLKIYAFLFFPGTVLHELAHLFTAMLLGLRIGRIMLIPDKVSFDEPLGSVEVEATKPFRLSFVGIAPFFYGLAAILAIVSFISLRGLQTDISDIFSNLFNLSFYFQVILNLLKNLSDPITLGLLYLAVSVSNHMYPSKADLKFWPYQIMTALLLAFVIYTCYYFDWFGLDVWSYAQKVFPLMYIIFIFTILLNSVMSLLFWLLNKPLAGRRGY